MVNKNSYSPFAGETVHVNNPSSSDDLPQTGVVVLLHNGMVFIDIDGVINIVDPECINKLSSDDEIRKQVILKISKECKSSIHERKLIARMYDSGFISYPYAGEDIKSQEGGAA